MKAVDGVAPSTLEHQLVPLWNKVVNRAPCVRLTKGGAAIHAPCRLHGSLDLVVANIIDLAPVEYAFKGVAVRVGVAVVVDEASRLVDVSERSVSALHLGSVVRRVRLVTPDLMVLAHGHTSLLLPCGSRPGNRGG